MHSGPHRSALNLLHNQLVLTPRIHILLDTKIRFVVFTVFLGICQAINALICLFPMVGPAGAGTIDPLYPANAAT